MRHSEINVADENVIVFDNLYRPAEMIGDLQTIKAKKPDSFLNTNAPGVLPSMTELNDIFDLGSSAGKKFKANFS